MPNEELFIAKYQEFEFWARRTYDITEMKQLERRGAELQRLYHPLSMLRLVRNILAHDKKLIRVTDDAIELLDEVTDTLMHPKMAIEVAKPRREVLCKGVDDKVQDVIKAMKRYDYSHIPILQGFKVWGIFSEDTLFGIYANGAIDSIRNESTCYQIADYIRLDRIDDGRYDFIGRSSSLEEVRLLFSQRIAQGKHLDILLVTETGNPEEPLLGIITPRDIV